MHLRHPLSGDARTIKVAVAGQLARQACMRQALPVMSSVTATPSSRVQLLDTMRGFALAGIVIINAMSIFAVKGSTPAFTVKIPPIDRLLRDLILLCVESKFFTLFSLLFGIGFAIQIASAERQGTTFLPRISRRLLALLLFGVLHIALLWDGDILVIYAVTGALLIAMRTLSQSATRRWIVGLLGVPSFLVLAGLAYTLLARLSPSGSAALVASDASIATEFGDISSTQQILDSSFVASISERIHSYVALSPLLISRIPTVLAMFLLGLQLGKTGVFRAPEEHRQMLLRCRRLGLSIGFSLMAAIVVATKFLPATSALLAIIEDQYLAGPILCIGFASALTLAYLTRPHRRIFGHFAAVGQMALTNYLGQSLVLVILAYGWGFGLASHLSGFEVLGVVAVLYCGQVALSTLWLRRFAYGPLEWAWRCLTYWQRVPLMRMAQGQE
jgi:uncharacterized protein